MLPSQIFYNPETDEILEFMPTLVTTKIIPETSTVIIEDGYAIFSEKEPDLTMTRILKEDVAIKYPHLVYLDSIPNNEGMVINYKHPLLNDCNRLIIEIPNQENNGIYKITEIIENQELTDD